MQWRRAAFAAHGGVPGCCARVCESRALAVHMTCDQRSGAPVSRRAALSGAASMLAAALVAPHARAAMYSTSVKSTGRYASATDPKTTLPDLMPQINDGYKVLIDLQNRWEEKTAALDGDVVRRILGTVGVTSPLFNIRKTFLRAWKLVAESGEVDEETIDDLETAWNGVLDGISAVDYQVYSIGYTELLETKLNLVSKSKDSLDSTIELYRQFLEGIPKSLL